MHRNSESGVALLTVMWLTVALTFIGMATAQMVRTEVNAVSNELEAQQAYYLARGGMEHAIYSIARSTFIPRDAEAPLLPSEFGPGKRTLEFRLESGTALVNVMPENAKLNVNAASVEQLTAVFTGLGVQPNEAADLAAAVQEWRSPRASELDTPLDLYYTGLPEPYVARHLVLNLVDELLPVRGMTRNLFFGRTRRNGAEWRKLPALGDLFTTENPGPWINPNYAAPEILQTLPGWTAGTAEKVVAARELEPFRSLDDMYRIVPETIPSQESAPLTLAQGPVFTLTATGLLPGSGVRRTVRALVWIGAAAPLYHQILGWWDSWPTPVATPGDTPDDASQGGQARSEQQL